MEKYREDFEREYYQRDGHFGFPFREVFEQNKEFKEMLFDEYCKAELHPCAERYYRRYFSKEQLDDMVRAEREGRDASEGLRRIREIHAEYLNLKVKKKLPEAYYAPDITKTTIYQILKEVERLVSIFEKSALDDNVNVYNEPINTVDAIIREIEKISNKDFALAILNDIICSNDNTVLRTDEIVELIVNHSHSGKTLRSERDKWDRMKITANNKLSEYKCKICTKEIESPEEMGAKSVKGEKPQRTINNEELEQYFLPAFKGNGDVKINYFEMLITELEINRTAKEFAQIALMIYRGKQMSRRKPKTFAKWYKIFCGCIGVVPAKGYKPNNLNTPSEALIKLFNYLQ
jgi:hypothetical protein